MSATVWCQLANGPEHKELHATKDAAVQALAATLGAHTKKGHKVSEERSEDGQRLRHIVKDADGNPVAVYEILN